MGSLGGLAFVVLFVIGSLVDLHGPDGDEPPAKYAAFYGDSGHRDKINIGWILAGLGVFFFLWFVASLRETVRKATVASEGESMLAFLVTIGGTAYGAVTLVALGEAAGVRTMSDDTFQHQVFPGIIHANDDGVYIAHATGTAALAAMIFAFSITVLATRALPAGSAGSDLSRRSRPWSRSSSSPCSSGCSGSRSRPWCCSWQHAGDRQHAESHCRHRRPVCPPRKRAARGTRRQWESSRSPTSPCSPRLGKPRAAAIPRTRWIGHLDAARLRRRARMAHGRGERRRHR